VASVRQLNEAPFASEDFCQEGETWRQLCWLFNMGVGAGKQYMHPMIVELIDKRV
jgi:hypothetical protein